MDQFFCLPSAIRARVPEEVRTVVMIECYKEATGRQFYRVGKPGSVTETNDLCTLEAAYLSSKRQLLHDYAVPIDKIAERLKPWSCSKLRFTLQPDAIISVLTMPPTAVTGRVF